jgi:hypothetical protein
MTICCVVPRVDSTRKARLCIVGNQMPRLNRTEAGLITISDPGADKPISEVSTVRCSHCGGHFYPKPGSGRIRGWCTSCNGPVCGPGCAACVNWEQYLENLEKGRDPEFKPVQVYVPADVPE